MTTKVQMVKVFDEETDGLGVNGTVHEAAKFLLAIRGYKAEIRGDCLYTEQWIAEDAKRLFHPGQSIEAAKGDRG